MLNGLLSVHLSTHNFFNFYLTIAEKCFDLHPRAALLLQTQGKK